YVPRERDTGFARRLDGGVELLPRQPRVQLDEVVTGARLLADHAARLVRARNALPAERGPRRDQARAQHVVPREALAQLEMVRLAEHAACRRDAVGHIEK